MKVSIFMFFIIVIGTYALVNGYIFLRGWQALELFPKLRVLYAVIFWLSASAFILGRVFERMTSGFAVDVVVWWGSLWVGFLIYLFFFVIILDIARFGFFVSGFSPVGFIQNYERFKIIVAGIGIIVSACVVTSGFVNARTPIVRNLSVNIPQEVSGKKTWNIIAVSDVHLGTLVNSSRAESLVSSIRSFHPDLVLFLGDTLDEDAESALRRDVGFALKEIQAPYGIFGIAGNHEYISGIDSSINYLETHGVRVLRDQYSVIGGAFTLVGRDDRSNKNRKSLDNLLEEISTSTPIILLDHQPFYLKDVAENGRVHLQLSGHTHHGQLWPFNFITKSVYEVSWGYKKINYTHFYVSSGWGTWGPPIRTGNTPELIHLVLTFK